MVHCRPSTAFQVEIWSWRAAKAPLSVYRRLRRSISPAPVRMRNPWPCLVLITLGACRETSGPGTISVSLHVVEVLPLACDQGSCSDLLTIEARDTLADLPLAIDLSTAGAGIHPGMVSTTLPTGTVTFAWHYPSEQGRYQLEVCVPLYPDAVCLQFLDIVQ